MKSNLLRLFAIAFVCGLVAPTSAFAVRINGVPYNCFNAVKGELIRQFARENKGDKEAIEEHRKFIRSAPAYACRLRQNPKIEDFAWCDGSGCTGARATKLKDGCKVSDVWSGQDDGDIIEADIYRKTCLTRKDF